MANRVLMAIVGVAASVACAAFVGCQLAFPLHEANPSDGAIDGAIDGGTDGFDPNVGGIHCGSVFCFPYDNPALECCRTGPAPYTLSCLTHTDCNANDSGVHIECDDNTDCAPGAWCCVFDFIDSRYGSQCMVPIGGACPGGRVQMCNMALAGADCIDSGPCVPYGSALPGSFSICTKN